MGSKFELHLHYYIYFQTNNIGKGMKTLIPLKKYLAQSAGAVEYTNCTSAER